MTRHEYISPAAYLSLQAERDALVQERNTLQRQLHDVEADLQALGLEQQSLNALVKSQGQLSERSEYTYLQTIGALNYTILDVITRRQTHVRARKSRPRSSMP